MRLSKINWKVASNVLFPGCGLGGHVLHTQNRPQEPDTPFCLSVTKNECQPMIAFRASARGAKAEGEAVSTPRTPEGTRSLTGMQIIPGSLGFRVPSG